MGKTYRRATDKDKFDRKQRSDNRRKRKEHRVK